MARRNYRFKWPISFAHSFILLMISAAWMYTGYTYEYEQLLIKLASITKRVVFNSDEDPPKKDYLFVNLANEKELIPLEDGSGNEVITDRARLAAFFRIVKRHQHKIKFTLCDVFLQGHSVNDSVFNASLSGIKNVIFPTHFNDDGGIEPIVFNVPHAIADYSAGGGFFKFRLFQNDTLPTIPVYIYEQLTHKKIAKALGWYTEDGAPSLNAVIIDYQIRAHEVFEEAEYPVVKLSDLLVLPEDVLVTEFLKDRIIIMGDFNADIHETLYGPAPGSLILLNIYLTLKDGHNLISVWWVLGLIGAFTLLSHWILFPATQREIKEKPKWLVPLLKSAVYLSILSIISYLVCHQPVQVLVLTVYLNAVSIIIKVRQGRWTINRVKRKLNKVLPTKLNFRIR